MFPFIASALLPFRRRNVPEPEEPERRPAVSPLTLVPPPLPAANPIMLSNGGPTPLSRAIQAMLNILNNYTLPPIIQPPPPPPLPPSNVLLATVVERTVGVGSRVGMDLRGPFSVAELKGLRVESVVRFELWAHTPGDVAQAAEDLISRLLGDQETLRGQGFLRIALKSVNPSENIFSEDAWRQLIEFDMLFEFSYVDTSEAESLIAQIPIHINSEHNEDTTVRDQMARWDNESAPTLRARGPRQIGALTALAFIPAAEPVGGVTITRTFDGASGAPASFPTLADFVTAVAGNNPAERHAEVTFASLVQFLAAISTFKITDESLAGMTADGVSAAVVGQLQGIKDTEVAGEADFLALVEATIGPAETATFRDAILKHSAVLESIVLGDWDLDGVADEYKSSQFRIDPRISLTTVNDRLEIAFEHPELSEVAVVYLRASTGPSSFA
jgi:hypothetical protein